MGVVQQSGLVASVGASNCELYAQRMQIEQTFRDTKNVSSGPGLSASRSRSGQRFEMLLSLVHLALFVLHAVDATIN